MIFIFKKYSCVLSENTINKDILPKYHDTEMQYIYIFKIITYTCICFSIFFIQIIILSKCLEFLSNNQGENIIKSLVHNIFSNIKIQGIQTINYQYCLIILIAALVAQIFILFFEKEIFMKKRDLYYKIVKSKFESKYLGNLNGYTRFTEKFLNSDIDGIVYGLYSISNKNAWFIATVIAIYSLMIFFKLHTLSNDYPNLSTLDALIKEFQDNQANNIDFIDILKNYVSRLVLCLFPAIFFYMYHNAYKNFTRNQTFFIKNKINNFLSNTDQYNFNTHDLFNKKLIDDFFDTIGTYKSTFSIIYFISLAIVLGINLGNLNQTNNNNQNEINIEKYAYFCVFLLFLFLDSLFLQKFINKKNEIRLSETIVKISILDRLPLLKNNTNIGELNIVRMTFNNVFLKKIVNLGVVLKFSNPINMNLMHMNFINIDSKNPLNFTIAESLWQQAINIYQDAQPGYISLIDQDNTVVDLATIGNNNLSQLICIHENIRFYPKLTILENFQKFAPWVNEQDVNQVLKLAAIEDINSDTVYKKNFPRRIRNRLLVGLLILLSQKHNVIFCIYDIFLSYKQEEFISILQYIQRQNSMFTLIGNFEEIPDFIFKIFNIVYTITDRQVKQIHEI